MASQPMRNAPLLTAGELAERIDEFEAAVEQYNAGYWFESHETLEDLWMVTPLPDREFFQGVIQLAAAWVHFARGEYPGILKLLTAARARVAPFSPAHRSVDVGRLVEEIARAEEAVRSLGPEHFRRLDREMIPLIRRGEG